MAARNKVVANRQYSARELRSPLRDHPPLAECLSRPGRAAVILNPLQPIAAPENLDANFLRLDVEAPIELAERGGRYQLPLFGDRLRAAQALTTRRLHNDVHRCAYTWMEASDWLDKHNIMPKPKLSRMPSHAQADILVGGR